LPRRVATDEILETLAECYPDARCALNHSNAFELLVATILSAQCTDQRVNIITERLFQKARTPETILALGQDRLEEEIRDCGLFHNKARNILTTCQILLEQYGGEVPQTRDELMRLPGVGRKTANVVVSNAFGEPAIAVDTHVFRVANRLGLAQAKTPEETEQQLMRRIPRDLWSPAHHWLIHHGRQVCHARKPACEVCRLSPYCAHAAGIRSQGAKAAGAASGGKPRRPPADKP